MTYQQIKDIDPTDPEQIGKFMASIPEDEKKVLNERMMYFLPRWVEEQEKKRTLDALVDEDKKLLFQSILILSFAERSGKSNEVDPDIRPILVAIKDGDGGKMTELDQEFRKRAVRVRAEYESLFTKFKLEHLPKKKREQIENLRKSGNDKAIQNIIDGYYGAGDEKKTDEREVKNDSLTKANVRHLEESLDIYDKNLKLIDLSVFSSKALQLNPQYIDLIASIVSNPKLLFPQTGQNILDGIDVPNDFYAHHLLSITEYREWCNNIADSEQWNFMFLKLMSEIETILDIPIEEISQRKNVISEILASLEDRRFEIALIGLYTEIEGLLWDLSFAADREKKIYDNDVKHLIDSSTGMTFESTRIRDVVERTEFKNFVDTEFIKDFCECIYEERNPILHGRQVCFAKCDRAAQ